MSPFMPPIGVFFLILGVVFGLVALLGLLWVLAMMPGKRRGGFSFEGARIAHRGLHTQGMPENSPAAFRRAAERGLGVELDVQQTADGQLVVFHDATLKRVCGVDKAITKEPYEELKQYALLGTEEHIPLFSQVLQVLDGVPLVCEIKVSDGANIPALCQAAWEELKDYQGPWCIESFHPAAVRWFKVHQPQVIRGQLSQNMFRSREKLSGATKFLLTNLLTNFYTKPDFIAYNYRHEDTFGFRLCRALFRPYTAAWTPRGKDEIQKAESLGFDTLIFEE